MAYATLLSIIETLEFILNPPHHDQSPVLYQSRRPFLLSLHEKLSFLLSFMEEDFAQSRSQTMTRLETRIRKMAYKAVHIIESQVSDGLRLKSKDLKKIMEQVDSISAEVVSVKVKDLNVIKNNRPTKFSAVGSSKSVHVNKSPIVGFKDNLMAIKERLFTPPSELAIISIVGMGGIGKTTLARTIFDDSKIVSHFDACGWLTVSQKYDVQHMLGQLLKSIERNGSNKNEVRELGETLYKSLKQKRYLVVMDDVWDVKAWDDVRRFFPRDNTGSRIILTTRLLDVAINANSSSPIYSPSLLNLDNSWKLLCQNVFDDESCPRELEEIGKEIAKKCKGLPLALTIIGGLLSRGERKLHYWTYIQQNINSSLVDANDDFMEILALSYYHLPHQLRACFLYMSVFPEDYEVRKSDLIKLWVAEGFVKPHTSKSLEDVAHEYLQDLVDRNMILVHKWNSIGKIKRCGIHDLMRDLCARITQEEKFLRVVGAQVQVQSGGTLKYKSGVTIPSNNPDYRKGIYGPQARSLLQLGRARYEPQLFFILGFQQPRVLHALDLVGLPFDIANLRYLVVGSWIEFNIETSICKLLHLQTLINLKASISKLLHLQTLIINDDFSETIILPVEIWNMPRLRHLISRGQCIFPYPSGAQNGENFTLSKNLQTLKEVLNSSSTKDVLRLMPNLKKLGIIFDDDDDTELSSSVPEYFVHLHQLEDLCIFNNTNQNPLVEDFHLLSSLRKLTLDSFDLSSKTMAIIGSLPHLQALKIMWCRFLENVWEPTEGQFVQLKLLVISWTDLKHLKADETSFPSLECLDIQYCLGLKRIPSSIGDIPTLRLINVALSSKSVDKSAALIRKEQEDMGNENIKIIICPHLDSVEDSDEDDQNGDDEEDTEDEESDDDMEKNENGEDHDDAEDEESDDYKDDNEEDEDVGN